MYEWHGNCKDYESCSCGCLECGKGIHKCGHPRKCHWKCREN